MKKKAKQAKPPQPLDIAIGARIRDLRREQNPPVSQKWLAMELDMSLPQIQKYESGRNRIAFSRLCEIAKVLGVDPIDLQLPVLKAHKLVKPNKHISLER